MKENNEKIIVDLEAFPKPEAPSQVPKYTPFDVSERVKKEVNDELWNRMHPGEINLDRRSEVSIEPEVEKKRQENIEK